MRIRYLAKRENFYQILDTTIQNILKDEILSTYLIDKKNTEQERQVNELLNFITVKETPFSGFSNLYREYSFTQKYWRKPLQKVYAFLSVHQFSRPFLCHKKIKLPHSIQRNIVIIGGNHRIRFYDYLNKRMFIILKDGEEEEMVHNEIELRREHELSYAPPFIEHGDKWFIEGTVFGKPINRFKDPDFTMAIKRAAIKSHYQELIIPTLAMEKTEEYLAILRQSIDQKLKTIQAIQGWQELKTKVDRFLEDCFNRIAQQDIDYIPVAMNHGDFQSANILAQPDQSFRVIDWESVGRRFYLYDEFVLLSDIRQSAEKFNEIYAFSRQPNLFCDLRPELAAFPVSDNLHPDMRFALLTLEEFRFLIQDSLSINFNHPEKSILNFIRTFDSLSLSYEK